MASKDTSEVWRISKLSESDPISALAERRNTLYGTSSKLAAGAEVYPPSGTWTGTYTEDGLTGSTTYELKFNSEKETFEGTGRDADGSFDIELGCFEAASGQFIWSERTVRDGRTALFTVCKGRVAGKDAFKCIIQGTYEASTGRTGKITLRPAADK